MERFGKRGLRAGRRGPRRVPGDHRLQWQEPARAAAATRHRRGAVTLKVNFWGDIGLDDAQGRSTRRTTPTSRSSSTRASSTPSTRTCRRSWSPATARRTSRRSTRASSSSSAARPTSSSTCSTRAPASTSRSTWPGSGSSRCRRTARPRSGSAPTSAAWPCATAPTCSRRPACPPTATQVSALWPNWDDVHRRRQAVRREDRQEVRRLRHQHVQPGARPAAAGLLRRAGPAADGGRPQGRVRRQHEGDRGRPLRQPGQLPAELGPGLQEGPVRRARLPGVDARPHPGAPRPTRRASGTSPRSPAAAATGVAPSGPSRSRARTSTRRTSSSSG